MSKVTIYGMARSSLTRTVRIACIEKEIPFEFHTKGIPSPGALPTPELLQFNPFGKVPVLVQDNLVLYETSAICRYIDDAFDGPLLRPIRVDKIARMEQWISIAMTRLDQHILRQFVLPMVFADDETEILAESPNVDAAFTRFQGRPSAAITDPLLPDKILRSA